MKFPILAIDYGTHYIGIATCDEDGIFASPLTTLLHTTQAEVVKQVAQLLEEHLASHVLIGLPYHADGSESAMAKECKVFAQALKKTLPFLTISFIDEYGSSQAVEYNREVTQKLSPTKRKEEKLASHSKAAALMLQNYLDNIKI